MKRIIAAILILTIAMCFVSCDSDKDKGNEGISVVATLFPQYDFAKAILGEKGSVQLLLTPGADSHSFEITPSHMKSINNCDLFIYTGRDMEVWVDSIIASIDNDVDVLELSYAAHFDNVQQDDDHHHTDPHIWTSPVIARKMLKMIFDSICVIDPNNYDYYFNNYTAYDAELVKLHNEFGEIANAAVNKKLYFSGKFAFHHFVEEYGLEYYAPFNSCSDVQIESIATVRALIEEIKTNNVKYIFYEELSNNSVTDTIVNETNATALLLHSAHNVTKDELNSGVTYITIMQENATNLRKALCNG